MAGIYIHIPFCKQKCSYCNFHFSTNLQGKSDIQQALLQEIEWRRDEISALPIQTIYLGGGTPSLWSVREIEALYAKIQSITGPNSIEEFTIECNPDDLTIDYLEDLKRHSPVDRISIGIQSFHEEDLLVMNRSHNARQARNALENIFKVGYEEVSADLIFGLPDSNPDKWMENLISIHQYPVHHISCYNLTIEDKTAIKYELDQGRLFLPDEEEAIGQFYMARDFFRELGFLHYEISNYAKPGHLALHNTNYWKNVPYVGIGPSAHSYNGTQRRWNVADNRKYVKNISEGKVYWEGEDLSENDLYNEYIMTGLRTMWGVEESRIGQFSATIRQEFYNTLRQEVGKGNIKDKNASYILTPQGQALADQVIAAFFYL